MSFSDWVTIPPPEMMPANREITEIQKVLTATSRKADFPYRAKTGQLFVRVLTPVNWGRFVIPEEYQDSDAKRTRLQYGEVVSMGSTDEGVDLGDVVWFSRWKGDVIYLENQRYWRVDFPDLCVVVKGEDAEELKCTSNAS